MKRSNALLGIIFTSLMVLSIVATPVMAEDSAVSSPRIWTDKADYAPEETVTIYGTGFAPNSPITVNVIRPDGHVDSSLDAESKILYRVTIIYQPDGTTDADGNFTATYDLDGILGTYTVIATDGTNTATTTFTDGSWDVYFATNGLPNGQSITINGMYRPPESGVNFSVTFNSPGPSSSILIPSNKNVNYSGFPSSVTVGGVKYNLVSTSPSSPFNTGTGDGMINVVATYAAENRPPFLYPIGNKTVDEETTLTFTATASDPDFPPNNLTFSLIDAPSGASINSSTGEFSWTPTEEQGPGNYTFKVRVTDNGSPPLYDEEEITVTVNEVNRAPVLDSIGNKNISWGETLTFTATASDPDSDAVTVTATLTDSLSGDPIAGKIINFTIGSQSITANTSETGVATTTITLTQPAGTYTVASVFTGDSLYFGSNDSDSFTINKETVAITYTGDTFVITAGSSITTAPVRLAAHLTQEDDGYAGNLSLARVKFELTNQGTGQSYTFGNIPVNSLGYALITRDIQVGIYTITVTVELVNQYWTQIEACMDTLTVDSGTGKQMVTGGGWISDPSSTNGKGNFGFTVNYQKNGAPKGNFIYLFRGTDGYNYLVKSNSWQDGGLSFTSPDTAFFTGRCTIQKIDRATGAVVASWGNYRFTVDINDGQSTLKADTFALKVWDPNSGTIWKQIGPSTIGGGNIVIHSK